MGAAGPGRAGAGSAVGCSTGASACCGGAAGGASWCVAGLGLPELTELAARHGVELRDLRKPPAGLNVPTGENLDLGA